MRSLLVGILLLIFSPVFAIQFPTCCIICKQGQACGNSCIPKNQSCGLPVDWGCACDYRYVRIFEANQARCCFMQGGVSSCAGDRIVCNDGSFSQTCGCKFLLQKESASSSKLASRNPSDAAY